MHMTAPHHLKEERKRARQHSTQGFTLIELMMSVCVVAIALLAYIGGNLGISRMSEQVYEQSVAFNDAMRVVEQMRATAKTGTFPANVVAAFPHNSQTVNFTNLTSEQVVQTYVDSTADPLDVTITVTWSSRGQRTLSKSIRTLLTQRT